MLFHATESPSMLDWQLPLNLSLNPTRPPIPRDASGILLRLYVFLGAVATGLWLVRGLESGLGGTHTEFQVIHLWNIILLDTILMASPGDI